MTEQTNIQETVTQDSSIQDPKDLPSNEFEEVIASFEAKRNPQPIQETKPESQEEGLSRQERIELLQMRKRYEKELETVKKEKEEIKSLKEAAALAKQDPKKFLETFGVSYQELTEAILNNSELAETPEFKVNNLEKRLTEYEKRMEEYRIQEQRAKEQQQINQFVQQINTEIEAAGDDSELIRAKNAQGLVFEIINLYAERNNSLLDIGTAIRLAEQQLEEEAKSYLNTNKMKKNFSGSNSSSQQAQSQEKQSPKTLSNKLTQATSKPVKPSSQLSEEEFLESIAKEFDSKRRK